MENSINPSVSVKERDNLFLRNAAVTLVSFLLASTELLEKPAPLAIAFMSFLSGTSALFAFPGAAIGYAANGNISAAVPYIIVLTALTALRFLFGQYKNRITTAISSLSAGICAFAANMFSAKELSDIFAAAAFAVIAVLASLSLNYASSNISKVSHKNSLLFRLSVGYLYSLLIAAVTSLYIGPFNFGIILTAVSVLYIAEYKKSYSAMAGILSAIGLSAGNGGFSLSAMIIAAASLIISEMPQYGRLSKASILIFSSAAGMFLTGSNEYSAACIISVLTGSLSFVFLPERFIPVYSNICSAEIRSSSAPFSAFGKKLVDMGNAVEEMSDAISKTARAIDSYNFDDPSLIYNSTAEQVCRSCKNNMYCWGSCYNRSSDIMNKVLGDIRRGKFAAADSFQEHFSEVCERRNELAQSLNRQYAVYRSAEASARKITEMRELLSAQLSATKKMLISMSEELSEQNSSDFETAKKAEEALEACGFINPSVLALNTNDKLSVDAYAEGMVSCDEAEITDRLSFALHKNFDPPMITENAGRIHISISERSLFDADIHIYQKNKSNNSQNGDCCDCFNDGHGKLYMIISDGMGSGSRARIDSAFACSMISRMLKAGIGFEASMEMLNNSLMVKSSDESFATLDICCVDLYTGEVSLYKAGSSQTYIRCGKKFFCLDGSGIPLGVTAQTDYTSKRFSLSDGDIIIMSSDGAELQEDWLGNMLLRDNNADIHRVIDTIGEAVRLSSEKGKDDDVTVIGVKITK